MTDFLESVRPVEPNIRELLVELAALEDTVRAAGSGADDPAVLAALAREQAIIDELHRSR